MILRRKLINKFKHLEAIVAPLKDINIDTDTIIPKQFLKTIHRTGLGKFLFYDKRYIKDFDENKEFILNKDPWNNAEIIVGLQGAGLTNLLWSGKQTKIIELRRKLTNTLFENLAKQNNIKFNKIETDPLEKVIAKHYGTIKINIKKLEKII